MSSDRRTLFVLFGSVAEARVFAIEAADDGGESGFMTTLVDRLALVSHPEGPRHAWDELRARASLDCAVATVLWDPDPAAMTMTVTLGTDAAERALVAQAETGDYMLDDDEEVLGAAPDPAAETRVVFIRGKRRRHLLVPEALYDLLLAIANEKVTVELELPAPHDHIHDEAAAVVKSGRLRRSVRRLTGAPPESVWRFASATAGRSDRPVTDEELDAAAPETLTTEQVEALRMGATALERTSWRLAACDPIRDDELVELPLPSLARWSKPVRWAYAEGVDVTFPIGATGPLPSLDHRDFRGRSLAGARLAGHNLVGSVFDGVDLTGADLSRAVMLGLRARGAIFDGANLDGADLSDADLTGSTFRGASCKDVQLTGAVVVDCDFGGATIADPRVAREAIRWASNPKLGRGRVLDEAEGKVRIRFDDGSERVLKREFVEFE